MKCTFIEKKDMKVTSWGGGTTTEIAIFPEKALYAERNFIFRISTAAVTLDESDFTLLPDYDRIIAAIDGEMHLTHCKDGKIEHADILPRETVHRFDGGASTRCVGRARDLNLMLRKGRAVGSIEFIRKGGEAWISLEPNGTALIYDLSDGSACLCRPEPNEAGANDEMIYLSKHGDCALFRVTVL